MVGTLRTWFEKRNFGFVAVTFRENYFLHASNIIEIPEGLALPPEGARVEFDVAPAVKGGKLPMAVNARIVPAKGGQR